MPKETREVRLGPREGTVRTEDGKILEPPADWRLLPPGDAGLTRRLKASGPTWTVKEKKGRRTFSKGVWAPGETIDRLQATLEAERATPQYARKRAADLKRRARDHADYVREFRDSVLVFLAFAPEHAELADRLADAVTTHATPVGSGTVARTERIPVSQRAESAVIAWMRHQTTAYDDMTIVRIKGERRAVRRKLAEKSRRLLDRYRRGLDAEPDCPLRSAIKFDDETSTPS